MTAISNIFTSRASRALSYLSAICPEVAEKQHDEDRVNRKRHRLRIDAGKPRGLERHERREADLEYIVAHRAEELRPQKNGAKRRSPSSLNWPSPSACARRAAHDDWSLMFFFVLLMVMPGFMRREDAC